MSRIRWVDAPSMDPAEFFGYAGTEIAFRIYNHEPLRNEWVLTCDLPGISHVRHYADGLEAPDELKAIAERWMEDRS